MKSANNRKETVVKERKGENGNISMSVSVREDGTLMVTNRKITYNDGAIAYLSPRTMDKSLNTSRRPLKSEPKKINQVDPELNLKFSEMIFDEKIAAWHKLCDLETDWITELTSDKSYFKSIVYALRTFNQLRTIFIKTQYALSSEIASIVGKAPSKINEEVSSSNRLWQFLCYFPPEINFFNFIDSKSAFEEFKAKKGDPDAIAHHIIKSVQVKDYDKLSQRKQKKLQFIEAKPEAFARVKQIINDARENLIHYSEGYFHYVEILANAKTLKAHQLEIAHHLVKKLNQHFESYDKFQLSTMPALLKLESDLLSFSIADSKDPKSIYEAIDAYNEASIDHIKGKKNDYLNEAKFALERQKQKTVDKNKPALTPYTPVDVKKACEHDDIKTLRKILSKQPSLLTIRELFVACRYGQSKVVSFFCHEKDFGDEINTAFEGETVLSIAVKNNYPKIVETLLKKTRVKKTVLVDGEAFPVLSLATNPEMQRLIENTGYEGERAPEIEPALANLSPLVYQATLPDQSESDHDTNENAEDYFKNLDMQHIQLANKLESLARKVKNLPLLEYQFQQQAVLFGELQKEEQSCIEQIIPGHYAKAYKQHLKIAKKFENVQTALNSIQEKLQSLADKANNGQNKTAEPQSELPAMVEIKQEQLQSTDLPLEKKGELVPLRPHVDEAAAEIKVTTIPLSQRNTFFHACVRRQEQKFLAEKIELLKQFVMDFTPQDTLSQCMQLHALLFVLENIMEKHRHSFTLPGFSQHRAHQIRHALVYQYNLIPTEFSSSHFSSIYQTVIDFTRDFLSCSEAKNYLPLEQHKFFNELVQHGEVLATKNYAELHDLSFGKRIEHSFKLMSLELLFTRCPAPPGDQLRDCALSMVNIYKDKYAISGMADRPKAIADRHLLTK